MMTDHDKYKAIVDAIYWLQEHQRKANLNTGAKLEIEVAISTLRPLAAGTHVIVPVEPTDAIIDSMKNARRSCSASRVGGQTIEANYRTEMQVEFAMYRAMITASQETP